MLYLSMIRDLYDNSIAAYKIGMQQMVSLVLDTIRLAIKKKKAELQLHRDQSAQYALQAYFGLTKEYGITLTISRRRNPYDNSMAENFSRFLRRSIFTDIRLKILAHANCLIDNYIYLYNH